MKIKLYIIDDDIAIVKMLENIIEDNDLGNICGYSLSGANCIDEISALTPDIVLVDLLLPDKDGISIVKEITSVNNNTKFIMISQVSSKKLIGKAYDSGVDFYINKPININEVKTVIKNVSETIKYKSTLQNIQAMFLSDKINDSSSKSNDLPINLKLKKIQLILNKLGMSGEKGAQDILNICKYLLENNITTSNVTIGEVCNALYKNSKNAEQRIRRAISKGLSNIANLGIEDYMNEVFTMYSNSLFNFEEVKFEMDNIRGKNSASGKINIRKFIDGLIINIES